MMKLGSVTAIRKTGVSISGLGCYPNPLTPERAQGQVCIELEDRAYEGSLETRKASLVCSGSAGNGDGVPPLR